MSKEKSTLPKVYEDFLKDYIKKKGTIKININSLIKEIELTEKSFTDNGNMGLTSEYFTENDIRQKVTSKYAGQINDAQFIVMANSRIFKGKKNIIAVNSKTARALGFAFGLNLWDNPDAIKCCISNNDQKCKVKVKITDKISSLNNFVAVSRALAKTLNLGDKEEVELSKFKLAAKRINLDKIDNSYYESSWDDEY
jgi:hypothetical protein